VQGIDATMEANNLTALVFPANNGAAIAAKSGYPSVIVPAGYLSTASPFGITFTGKAYSEPFLIALAYSFEQATKVRQPPGSALRLLPVSAQVAPAQVAHYATGIAGPVAPGEMVAISGVGLGPSQAAAGSVTASRRIDTSAGGSRVLFDGIPAPILSAESRQIIAIVPYGMAGRQTARMTVEYGGQSSAPLTVPLTDADPAVLGDQPLGKGAVMVMNADGTRNSAANPAAKASYVTFFATGEGVLATLPVDGRLAAAPLQTPLQPARVTIGGADAEALFAGAAPGYAGMMQVNARIPEGAPSGATTLSLRVGSKNAPPVMIYVR
jgi:uncharacterized protein (TIGR03437 family)